MSRYHVAVEGIVARVVCVEADNLTDAVAEARREFSAQVGALTSKVTIVTKENDNDEHN